MPNIERALWLPQRAGGNVGDFAVLPDGEWHSRLLVPCHHPPDRLAHGRDGLVAQRLPVLHRCPPACLITWNTLPSSTTVRGPQPSATRRGVLPSLSNNNQELRSGRYGPRKLAILR